MRLRTLQAPNMPKAMQMVRETYGDEAIIVATHQDKQNGLITLTIGVEEAEVQPTAPKKPTMVKPDAVLAEPPTIDDVIDRISDALDYHRLPRRLSHRLLAALDDVADEPEMALAEVLGGYFSFKDFLRQPPSALMLVGLPGVGKTVSLAKIATRYVLEKKPVALVTTDTQKAGGVAQLEELAQTLGIPMQMVEDPMSLPRIMATLPLETIQLIDTPGIDIRDKSNIPHLQQVQQAAGALVGLVLDAATDQDMALEMAKLIGNHVPLTWLLPDKLDLCPRLGNVLSVADTVRLSLCVAGNSTDIAHGLLPLTPGSLAQALFKRNDLSTFLSYHANYA
jgi:flagellar biosynthesis protein FlhF